MVNEVLKDAPMNVDFQSDSIPCSYKPPGKAHQKAVSLDISWTGATGDLDGKIKIFTGNLPDGKSFAKEIAVDKASNVLDSEMILIYPVFKSIIISYEKNGVTGGLMTAAMYYE